MPSSLISAIQSDSFARGMNSFRDLVRERGYGELSLGGQSVSIRYVETDGRFQVTGTGGRLLTTLLSVGFNHGPESLRAIMLGMVTDSDTTQSPGGIAGKILQCQFDVNLDKLQCPPEAVQCPITLEQPEKGILVRNSPGSNVCVLFDAPAFSRVVGEGSCHPLTRAPITTSMIVPDGHCVYDPVKGNFVTKDS